MDRDRMLEYAKDLRADLKYAYESDEGQTPNHKDGAVMDWLIEQAIRADMYKKALCEIGAKHEPPSSRIANSILMEADLRFER